jgi:flavin reductase (DIM6/NTAB) family NADH-FMN oxidoreductase RutF
MSAVQLARAEAVDPLDARQFRNALGQFATGVTIVTTRSAEGVPVGLTVSSFNSVSLAPPLVLWSLAHTAASLPVFASGSHFAVHVLAGDQQALAERFAARGIDRWADLEFMDGLHGLPLLDGAAATFECRRHSQHQAGDHTILVGEVLRAQQRPGSAPLLYHGGRFYTDALA